MQGVEKLNHLLKMAFYRATNHASQGKAVSEQVSDLRHLQLVSRSPCVNFLILLGTHEGNVFRVSVLLLRGGG